MGINFAYARKKFSEAQQKLRKEYKAAGMTDEQILEMYEYDLHQFNRDLAYQRHTQRLGILEEPDMEEEGYNPLLHKFIDALTVYQQPTGAAKLWWLDEIEDADLIKSLMRLTDEFQSTLPARGATPLKAALVQGETFQSTLPARGATTMRRIRRCWKPYFNPRSPHGERHPVSRGD